MSVSTIANNTISVDVSGNIAQASWRCSPKQLAGLINVASYLPVKEASVLMKFALFSFEENKKNYQEYLKKQTSTTEASPEVVVEPTKE